MFDNLATAIVEGIQLSEKDQQLLNNLKKNPDLSYFQANPISQAAASPEGAENVSKVGSAKASHEKASLLRCIQAISRVSADSQNLHHKTCQDFVRALETSAVLHNLAKQAKEFTKYVIFETMLVLGHHCVKVAKSQPYIDEVCSLFNTVAAQYRPFLAVALLQSTGIEAGEPVQFSQETLKNIKGESLSPVLFASFLQPAGMELSGKVLYRFDVFNIIITEWIQPLNRIMSSYSLKCALSSIDSLILVFIKLFRRQLTQQTIVARLVPLVSCIVKHNPIRFQQLSDELSIFELRSHLAVIQYCAAACGSQSNADNVLLKLTGELFAFWGTSLRNALYEVPLEEGSDASFFSLWLLKRLFKRLSVTKLRILVNSLAPSFANDIPGYLKEFSAHPRLGVPATRALAHLSRLVPDAVAAVFPKAIGESEQGVIIDASLIGVTAETALAHVKIARALIDYSFRHDATLNEFPLYFSMRFFVSALFLPFPDRTRRWKTLTEILSAALDLSVCSGAFTEETRSNPSFLKVLIELLQNASSVTTFAMTSVYETATSRFDMGDSMSAIQFETLALKLITTILTDPETPVSLIQICFNSTLLPTLVTFLEPGPLFAAEALSLSLDLFQVLCRTAGKVGGIHVDASFPRASQIILIDSVKSNLFRASDSRQTARALNFVSETLETQPTFGYSFVRHIGSSYVSAALPRLAELAKVDQELLVETVKFVAKNAQLNPTLASTTYLSANNDKSWVPLFEVLKSPVSKDSFDLMLSKCYIIQCLSIVSKPLPADIAKLIVKQAIEVLPDTPITVKTPFKIDMKKFIRKAFPMKYGSEFYFDIKLLRRYLPSGHDVFIRSVEDLNMRLSMIDAVTKVLSVLPEAGIPSEMIIPLVRSVNLSYIYPDSTVKVVYQLLDRTLSSGADSTPHLDSNFLESISVVTQRDIESVFPVLSKLLASAVIFKESEDILISLFCTVLEYSTKKCLGQAAETASEIALHLVGRDGWICGVEGFETSIMTLFNKGVCVPALHILTSVSFNSENAKIVEKGDVINFLLSPQIPWYGDEAAAEWDAIFTLFSLLDSSFLFVNSHFSVVTKSIGKESVTSLLSSIASQLAEVKTEQPLLVKQIGTLMGSQLRSDIMLMRDTRDRLLSLNHCLTFFNELVEFPMNTVEPWYPDTSSLEAAIDVVMNHLLWKSNKPQFAMRVFELALRQYLSTAIAIRSVVPSTIQEVDALHKVEESIPRIMKKISDAIDLASRNGLSESKEFLESVRDYFRS